MPYHTVFYFVFFEVARWLDPMGGLGHDLFQVYRLDFALIMLCAGTYKALSGYLHNEGVDYALANPLWGRFYRFFRRLRPTSLLVRGQNIMGSLTELVIGLALLVPATQAVGGVLCALVFAYLFVVLRLATLPLLVASLSLLFLPDLGWGGAAPEVAASGAAPAGVLTALRGLAYAYLVLLVATKSMQYYNLLTGRTLPGPLQRGLEAWGRRVPIFIWRVFTADVTNFFVRIYELTPSGEKLPLFEEDRPMRVDRPARGGIRWRFYHPVESIALSSTFATARYFSDPGPFHQKLLRYTRTLRPHLTAAASRVLYEYVLIEKGTTCYRYRPLVRLYVDLQTGRVEEERLDPELDHTRPASHSRVRKDASPGTFRLAAK